MTRTTRELPAKEAGVSPRASTRSERAAVSVNAPTTPAQFAAMMACPIRLVRGLLPAGAPDASSISSCYEAGTMVLLGRGDTQRWALTHKGQQGLRDRRGVRDT